MSATSLLTWFRQRAAKNDDRSEPRTGPGRPRKANDVRALVLRVATENLGWGDTKLRDALRGRTIDIGRSTVASLLAEAGVEPAPERRRKRTCKPFLSSHGQTLDACDVFAVETLGVFGTVRVLVFFVLELTSRAVPIAGIRTDPDGTWRRQVARNLLAPVDGFLRNATHLLHDRDPLFTTAWTALRNTGGVKTVPLPASRPNGNPHAERLVKTVRTECLEPFVLFGQRHREHLLRAFVAHDHAERYPQGIGGKIVRPLPSASNDKAALGTLQRRSRLGGRLSFDGRDAA